MRTQLWEEMKAAGAVITDFFGWEIADHFGEPEEEYRDARTAAVLFDLSWAGKLEVRGRDRVRYLHNMLSNDVKGLGVGQGCHAALLTHQGRMEADLYVFALEDCLRLEIPPAAKERALATLRKYVVSEDVVIDDRTEEMAVLSVQGPRAPEFLEGVLGEPVSDLGLLSHRPAGQPGGEWFLVRRDRTGCGGFDLWLPASSARECWRRWTESGTVRPAGLRALDQLRTEAGIPWYGRDMSDRTLPMEVGLRDAISLNKGCYRGQEIVARIHYRGNLERSLGGIAVRAESLPPAGAKVLFEGAKAGEVTSAVFSPRLACPLALAVMGRRCLAPGTPIEIESGDGGSIPGVTVRLPLE